MRKLMVFESISADGFFADRNSGISWAHRPTADNADFHAFVNNNASMGGQLLFGRVTYEMMLSYWPTPMAKQNDPVVAEGMNKAHKIVFSRSLKSADWNNTTLMNGDLVEEVRRLKEAPGAGMTILGSGSIVSQLTKAGLIDGYQLVVVPVVLGDGRRLFDGLDKMLELELRDSRKFSNGNVLLSYETATAIAGG
jgi:dihydrofolate reductase